jgi:hypothetical protein
MRRRTLTWSGRLTWDRRLLRRTGHHLRTTVRRRVHHRGEASSHNNSISILILFRLFLYEVTNSIFASCNALSSLHLLRAGRIGR